MKVLVRWKGGRLLQVLFVALLLSAVPAMSWATVEQDLKSGLPVAQVLTNALKAGMTLDEAVAEVIHFFNASQSLSQTEKANELAKLEAAVKDVMTVASGPARKVIMAPDPHAGSQNRGHFPGGRAVASPHN